MADFGCMLASLGLITLAGSKHHKGRAPMQWTLFVVLLLLNICMSCNYAWQCCHFQFVSWCKTLMMISDWPVAELAGYCLSFTMLYICNRHISVKLAFKYAVIMQVDSVTLKILASNHSGLVGLYILHLYWVLLIRYNLLCVMIVHAEI